MATYSELIINDTCLNEKPPLQSPRDLIDYHTRSYLDVIFYVGVQGPITIIGCTGNIVNIVVFVKQGFKETVNISLMALAISDLGALVTLLWMSVCYTPAFRFSGIPFESTDIEHITACWPHGSFARITSCITAFITLERCLCITVPLKVKEIITARRTIAVNVFLFALMFGILSPAFYADQFGPVSIPERNTTLIGLVFAENGQFIENICKAMDVSVQMISFFVVIVCTTVLVKNLIKNTKLRSEMSNSSVPRSGQNLSSRDKKVVRMITAISCMFITCFLPTVVNFITMFFIPGYGFKGVYSNTFRFVWSILKILESIHSSSTIIIYYKMSSKYRTTLLGMTCISRIGNNRFSQKTTTEGSGSQAITSSTTCSP